MPPLSAFLRFIALFSFSMVFIAQFRSLSCSCLFTYYNDRFSFFSPFPMILLQCTDQHLLLRPRLRHV